MNRNTNVSTPTEITMLKAAKGYTRHDGPPHLVEFSVDAEEIVSRDLATFWVASGTCKLRSPKPAVKKAVDASAAEIHNEQAKEKSRVAAVKKAGAARAARRGIRPQPKAKAAK